MNSTDRILFDTIRRDQDRIHDLVRGVDDRIAILQRRFQERTPEQPASLPPPLPEIVSRPAATHSAATSVPPETPRPEPVQPAVKSAAPFVPLPPLSPATEKPRSAEPPPAPDNTAEPLEMRVATYWMARIGIVVLLTGLVFLGNYAYHRIVPFLGAAGKLSLIALAGAALGGLGAWLDRRRESMRNYARVLMAGGAATIYYAAYAAHYVAALRVIESPLLGGALLLALGGSFLWFAERRRSEALALSAVVLAYYTSAINAIGGFTLFSNLLLTGAGVFLLVRHRWTKLSHLCLVATYGSYGFWRFHEVAQTGSGGEFGFGLAFLAGYWILFTAAAFLVSSGAMRGAERVTFVTANNGALFAFGASHFAAHHPGSFWIFALGFGGVLLGLAALAWRMRTEDLELDSTYLAQGLALVTLGLAAKLSGPQLAVVLAVESAVLLTGSKRRHGWLFAIAAGLCALGATLLVLHGLSRDLFRPLPVGLPVAALLLADAWWVKRLSGKWDAFSERALAFSALGLATLAGTLWKAVPPQWQPVAFAAIAVASLIAWRLRLPEIAFPAQGFLAVGIGMFLVRNFPEMADPSWNALALVAMTIGLMHYWLRTPRTIAPELRCALGFLYAGGAMAVANVWLHGRFPGDSWLVATSAAAIATLVYGSLTRAAALAIVGQIFSALSVLAFGRAVLGGHPAWYAALAPVLNLAATSLALGRLPVATESSFPLAPVQRAYRLAALALFGAWGFEYVGSAWRVEFFAALGATLIAAGELTRQRERAACGAVYSALALAIFWSSWKVAPTALDLAAIFLIPASYRVARRFSGEEPLFPTARHALVLAAMATLWQWTTRWTIAHGHSSQLTVAWALLAVVIFAAGLILRERFYRLGGFAVLGLALGRLFIVDVWRFDTLPRILSFLVLGVVLLSLSFVYNRFADTIRRWL